MATYYGSRKESPRVLELRRKRGEHRFFVLYAIFITLVVGFLGVVLIIRMPTFRITTVHVSGTEVTSPLAVQAEIFSQLSGTILWIIPKNSILVYPKKEILEDITEKFPRLKDSRLVPDGFRALSFTATERKGLYLWCGNNFSLDGICMYLDDQGYVFAPAPAFSGTIYLKFFGGAVSDEANAIGTQVVSPEMFSTVVAFSEGLEKLGFTPHAVVLLGDTNEFLIGTPPMENRGRIVVKSNDNPETLLSYLSAALATDPLKSKMIKTPDALEYIDLRFSKKVYYKFSDSADASQTDGTKKNG